MNAKLEINLFRKNGRKMKKSRHKWMKFRYLDIEWQKKVIFC